MNSFFKSICFLFFLLNISNSFSQNSFSEYIQLPKYKGKLKQLKETNFDYRLIESSKQLNINAEYVTHHLYFNQLQEMILPKNGTSIINAKKIIAIHYTELNQIASIVTEKDSLAYYYDGLKLMEAAFFDENKELLNFEVFKYNDKGNVIKKYTGWKDHVIKDSTIYFYDDSKLLQSKNYFKGELNILTNYQYSKEGIKQSIETYNIMSFEFNDSVIKYKRESFSSFGSIIKQEEVYTTIKWIKKEVEISPYSTTNNFAIGPERISNFPSDYIRSQNSSDTISIKYYYTETNLLDRFERIDSEGFIYEKYFYKYDLMNNCISEGVFYENKFYPIIERSFIYF